MQKNELYDIEIIDSGMDGEGVARLEGKVVFVPHTIKGENVRVRITDIRKDYLRAQCIKVLTPSENRKIPECPYYFKCGSCDMMHIEKKAEKQIKIDEFKKNMTKIAGISISNVDFIESDIEFEYRNKVQFPFGLKDGKTIVGYYAYNSHKVIPIEKCMLNGAWADAIARDFLVYANAEKLSVYDEKTGKGLLRHLVMRNINGKISIVIVINGDKIPNIDKFTTNADISLFYSVNRKNTNVIMGDKIIILRGNSTIDTEISGVKVKLSPDVFMQINDNVRDKLYATALYELNGYETIIDLYSGIGITSNELAAKCNSVYSVEIVPAAAENARNMAKLNGNEDKITTICGDAAFELPKLVSKFKHNAANFAVLMDPPRKGCDRKVLEAVATVRPDKIVYISCNHATLARDIKILQELTDSSYKLDSSALFDMFPNTHHVESLITLQKIINNV